MRVREWKKEDRRITAQVYKDSTYSVSDVGGEKLFQIQTRASSGAVCQTVQFDRDRAAELIDILKKEFEL